MEEDSSNGNERGDEARANEEGEGTDNEEGGKDSGGTGVDSDSDSDVEEASFCNDTAVVKSREKGRTGKRFLAVAARLMSHPRRRGVSGNVPTPSPSTCPWHLHQCLPATTHA